MCEYNSEIIFQNVYILKSYTSFKLKKFGRRVIIQFLFKLLDFE